MTPFDRCCPQIWSVALKFRYEEPQFVRWTKDIGLLQMRQYQHYLVQ